MTTATEPKSEKIQTIISDVSNLTVLELSELVKALETKFGVSAAAPVAVAASAPVAAGGAPEQKTEFEVILSGSGDKKIQVIKVIRELTGLGLKEAKDLVDGAPKTIKASVTKEEAENIKVKVEAAGGKVDLK